MIHSKRGIRSSHPHVVLELTHWLVFLDTRPTPPSKEFACLGRGTLTLLAAAAASDFGSYGAGHVDSRDRFHIVEGNGVGEVCASMGLRPVGDAAGVGPRSPDATIC